MLPIRLVLWPRFAETLSMVLTLLLLLGSIVAPLGAAPLPPVGVEDFRELIDPAYTPKPEPAAAGPLLVEYRRKLRRAAENLPSLGEVSRVLLMSEWSLIELDSASSVPLDRLRKIVQAKDDDFIREVQKLMADQSEDRFSLNSLSQALVAEIQREVRLQLLDRLIDRTRFYLSQGRVADRIAAANLISDTMSTSRRQDISQFRTESGAILSGVMITTPKDITPSSHYLRRRLRALSSDLEKLVADSDILVQIAGIRALSDLEKEPGELVTLLKPVLASSQSNVLIRRAAAEALEHSLDVYTTPQVDKTRPQPYLKAVEQVLPVAAASLTDSDPLVRRASLEACQRTALILDELTNDPLLRERYYPAFRPTLAVVDAVLPKINAGSRDSIPELRVGACQVLETFALTVQRLRSSKKERVPEPGKLSPSPNKERNQYKRQASPPLSGVDRANRASQHFGANEANSRNTPMPSSSVLVPTVASVAQPLDELPPPGLVEDSGIQSVVQAMIANLKHADYRVRLAAVYTLETFGEQAEAAIPALVAALRDSNKFVRWNSARTLGRLSPRRADEVVPGLMRLLDDHEDPSVRIAAASALERYGEHAKKAVPLLAHVINRGDKEYILAILHALQGIGTDAATALPNVAWVLSDRTQPPSVRIEAAQTLGRFGPLARDQLPILRDVMNTDPDEDIRNAASAAVLAVDRPSTRTR